MTGRPTVPTQRSDLEPAGVESKCMKETNLPHHLAWEDDLGSAGNKRRSSSQAEPSSFPTLASDGSTVLSRQQQVEGGWRSSQLAEPYSASNRAAGDNMTM